MRKALPLLLALCSCRSAPEAPPVVPPSARDAPAASWAEARLRAAEVDEATWERTRRAAPTPIQLELFRLALRLHAERHGLELRSLRLLPLTVARIELPETLEAGEPFPLLARDALLRVPLVFALAPPEPARVEAFVRSLPELELLFAAKSMERRADAVELAVDGYTFRPVEPLPRHVEEGLAPETAALVRRLPAAELARRRVEGAELARARAVRNAAALEVPPAPSADLPAPRTTVDR